MKLNLINFKNDEKLKCRYCGSKRNVENKIEVIIIDTLPADDESNYVPICNTCLKRVIKSMEKISNFKNEIFVKGDKKMEIHFYESMNVLPDGENIIHDWKSINDIFKHIYAKRDNYHIIHTTQMCMLSTQWLLAGYQMFVHQDNGITYEITLQSKNNNGNRAVRISQNVYAMWASNVFRE